MDWEELTKLAHAEPFVVERIRLKEKNIAIEGSFEVPQLARLSHEDQIFVTAFVRCHGSIKEMEQTFGVSYPTVKARLTRIGNALEFIEVNPAPTSTDVLDRLNRGEISVDEALRNLQSRV